MVDEYIFNTATGDAKLGSTRREADNFVFILHNYELRRLEDLGFCTSGSIDT